MLAVLAPFQAVLAPFQPQQSQPPYPHLHSLTLQNILPISYLQHPSLNILPSPAFTLFSPRHSFLHPLHLLPKHFLILLRICSPLPNTVLIYTHSCIMHNPFCLISLLKVQIFSIFLSQPISFPASFLPHLSSHSLRCSHLLPFFCHSLLASNIVF